MELLVEKAQYTFADCLTWDESERIEIINGEAFMMTPPSSRHQEVCFEIGRQLGNFLEGKHCKVYPAPFSVRLFEQDGNAPDLVIEILSPSTQRQDRLVKLNLYQQAKVLEYWIVDPDTQSVQGFLLDDCGFPRIHEDYGREDAAKVHVLDGGFIELSKVFSE